MVGSIARREPVRVLVADDHTLVREGIVKLLSTDRYFQVVGEAANGFEAVTKARELRPDIVLLDLYMPGMDGFEAMRVIRPEMPEVSLVVLSVSSEEEDIVEAMREGARGYILKTAVADELLQQLKRVGSGAGAALSQEMTNRLVNGLAHRNQTAREPEPDVQALLTEREKEVLVLIAKGASNKDIAARLIISEHTVRAHVRTIMQKLDLSNRTQLAVCGVRHGFGLEDKEYDPRQATRRPLAVG